MLHSGDLRSQEHAPPASPEPEPALEPALPIIDPHFHLRDYREADDPRPRYRAAGFAADVAASGHAVHDSVFIECSIMYREDGPAPLRSLGETAYVAQQAGQHGALRVSGGIVARIDLAAEPPLEALIDAHIEAAGGRLRGVRNSIAWDAYGPLAAMGTDPHLFERPAFREGLRHLSRHDLSFETWQFHPQIEQVTALVRAFPENRFVLEHLGAPLGIGPYAGKLDEVFAAWRKDIVALAQLPNVVAKIGGLGPFWQRAPAVPVTSQTLARDWRRWIETTIEAFGPKRSMFESNWPANSSVSSYGQIWNAFKLVTQDCTDSEKAALYQNTARSTYRL